MARGNSCYFKIGMAPVVPEIELMPSDVESEYTDEQMEEAEEEVQEIFDRYYGQRRED